MFGLLASPLPFPFAWKALAVVLLAVSLLGFGYFKGVQTTTDKYEARIAKEALEAEKKYNELLVKKNKVDVQIVTEYVDRIVEVVKWRTKNVEVIKLVPDTGVLSSGWVHVHDSSAQARDADATRASDATPSGIKTTDALEGVVDNYATCKKNSEQLAALQKWIREQGKLTREIK